MRKSRVFVAGHKGMVGSALCRLLSSDQSVELVLRSRSELDLVDRREVKKFFESERIDED